MRRAVHGSRISGCGRPLRMLRTVTEDTEGARLSALHRGACHANQGRGSVQAVFPGTCGGRRYLPLRCPSPAGHPAGRS